jgi:hypothetical protein
LIAAGIICLCLSGAVVGSGWWQGTLQAFGVGFVVGGVIDVLAIFALNQVVTGEEKQRLHDLEAKAILRNDADKFSHGRAAAASELLERSGKDIDSELRTRLIALITDYLVEMRQDRAPAERYDGVFLPRELR